MKTLFFLVLILLISPAVFAEEDDVEIACPESVHPMCSAEERLDVEKDANGCNVTTCVKTASTRVDETFDEVCPPFERVPCSKYENPSFITNEKGCKVATCERL